jgi:transcription termination factor Rho
MRALMALKDEHLADLHRRARELGVPRYRMLPREELIEAIEERGDEPAPEGDESVEPEPQAAEPETAEPEEEVEAEEVTGVLDRMPQGYGFLRLSGMSEAEGDVYVSASQIRRCELRPGDQVTGPARQPRRGERHRALVRVETVNGQSPEGERRHFEDLTAAPPHRRLLPPDAAGDPLVRAVDLLGPLAFGQRVLVLAQPRSGRTTLLRALGSAIAESGEHVCILIDSLSRLALGYRDPSRVKRIFGAGRELDEEGSGSLTVIATVLDSDDKGAEVREALETTENLLLRLDAGLAAKGIIPALVAADSRASGEDGLREADELGQVRRLREELAEMDPDQAALALAEQIAATSNNAELLIRL